MRSLIVGDNEKNQRLDKLLLKYLDSSQSSFVYKMLRKKNITLNDKKATGNERLEKGDEIKLWLSEETLEKFISKNKIMTENKTLTSEFKFEKELIIYEDDNVLLYNKPVGLLSQKAKNDDVSLNELFIEYLLKEGKISGQSLKTFKPSVCNRLDRNTTGIIVLGKSLFGLQTINKMIHERSIKKYYLCIVKGKLSGKKHIKAWLYKDEKTNKVKVDDKEFKDARYIETEYEALYADDEKSLLKVNLLTGRTHQIRAHLAYIGHEILGDPKYAKRNNKALNTQLLHSYELFVPEIEGMENFGNRLYRADVPKIYKEIMKNYRWELGNQEA